MAVKHEAFLDLEQSLTSRLNKAFSRLWTPLGSRIEEAVVQGQFDKAHQLLDTLDLQDLVVKQARYVETMGATALLLGASRVVNPKKSQIVRQSKTELHNLVAQFGLIIARNAVLGMQKSGHLAISQRELAYRVRKSGAIYKRQGENYHVGISTSKQAEGYFSIAAGLHLSRLASYGFLSEGYSKGLVTYTVSEVLDSRTCPVCQIMHGKEFPMQAGVSQAMAIMQSDDPDGLTMVAPWPSRSKADMQWLEAASIEELVEEGLQLPPYHPGCRGLVTITEEPMDIDPSPDSRIGLGTAIRYKVELPHTHRVPHTSGSQLLGDLSDLDDEYNRIGAEADKYGLSDLKIEMQLRQEEQQRRRNLLALGLATTLLVTLNEKDPQASSIPDYDAMLDEDLRDPDYDEALDWRLEDLP